MEWEVSREILYGMEEDVASGKEIEVNLYNKETYEVVSVRAIMIESPDQSTEGDILWVRDFNGRVEEKPWKVKIIERLASPWE